MSTAIYRAYALGLCGLGALLTSCSVSQPHDPATAVREALESHPVVELSRTEGIGNRTELNLVENLLNDGRLERKLDDIVIECGNSRYQTVLSRYVAGGNVTRQQLQVVWRKTTQIVGCEADPTTEMLIVFVRNLNCISRDFV